MSDLGEQASESADGLDEAIIATQDQTDALAAAEQALQNYSAPLDDVDRTTRALAVAESDLADAHATLTGLVEAGTASAQEITEAQMAWQQATDQVDQAERSLSSAIAQRREEQARAAEEACRNQAQGSRRD